MTTTGTAEELADRVFEACNATFDVLTIHLGRKLGLYQALVDLGAATSTEVAEQSETDERYVREWLEQQAVAGFLAVADPTVDALDRRYILSAGYAEVLLDRDSLLYLGPAAQMTAAAAATLPQVAEAFRSGDGVPWEAFGDDMRRGQGEMNRPLLLQVLGPDWLSAIPDVHEMLSTSGARAAEIGCGYGYGAIGVAEAYPSAVVTGFDIDEPSIETARKIAAERGVTERSAFFAVDPADTDMEDEYDVVFAIECVHDMGSPVDVLASMRRLVKAGGAVIVIDERTEDVFTPDAGDMERLLYGFSVTTCLPDSMSHEGSAATGTVMRRSTLEMYSREAGFEGLEVLPIEHDQFRVYRLI